MYLISAYFDEKTNRTLQRYIDRIAEKTGNTFMTDHHVPPLLADFRKKMLNSQELRGNIKYQHMEREETKDEFIGRKNQKGRSRQGRKYSEG